MNKFEQLIEHIINDEQDKARALFHDIVVEKSRDIYEGLVDEELVSERGVEREPVDSLVDEVESDEEGMTEEDEFPAADDEAGEEDLGDEEDMGDGEEDFGDEMPADDEMSSDLPDEEGLEGEEGSVEDRVMDLESELDALKAEFDALMAQEEGEPEHSDLDMDDGLGAEGDEMPVDDGMGDMGGEEDLGMEEPAAPAFAESKNRTQNQRKSAGETMREYVEKVSLPSNKSEGGEVGSGGKSASVNTKHIVAGKNDMGGTASNIAKGGSESSPEGTSPKQASNYGTKGKGNLPGADKFENVPGANTKGYTDKKSAKTKEEGSVEKKSPLAK